MKKILLPLVVFAHITLNAQEFIEGQEIMGGFPTAAEFVDVDGDNDLDLIRTMDQASGLNSINANQVWLNDGLGNFTFHMSFGDSESRDLAIGDLDDDGDMDVFVANGTGFVGLSTISTNKVWLNDGSGDFTSNGQNLGLRRSTSVTLFDIDGDNDLDACVGNSGDDNNQNTVWLNDGNGQFTNSGQLLGTQATQAIESADMDGDGDIDVITANCCNSVSNPNQIWFNDGSGNLTNSGQNLGDVSSKDIVAADLNGDTIPDLVFANSFANSTQYFNDENGLLTFHSNIYGSQPTSSIIAADFDNDNDLDLLIGMHNSVDTNRILINDGTGHYTEGFKFNKSYTLNLAQGDVDNDGDIDVLTVNVNNEKNRIWLNLSVVLSVEENLFYETNVYPNPTRNNLNVDLGELNTSVKATLINSLGQVVLTEQFESTDFIKLYVDGPKGIYFLRLELDERRNKTIKVLKE